MNPSFSQGVALRLLQTLVGSGLWASACSATDEPAASGEPRPAEVVDTAIELLSPSESHPGKALFEKAPPATNGRSCASCHVLDEATTLRPDSVAARLAADPSDPLFNRIDADDPSAETPSYEHLKKGLVRVVLPLPDNMDVIDEGGNVVSSPERTVFVWRGVPSVANVALTAPYQFDGRQETLESQAQAALRSHAEGPDAPARALGLVADFQRQLFSSPRAWLVSRLLVAGLPLEEIPVPEDFMPLSATEKRGRELYEIGCQPCHGSASTDRIVDREVHDLFFAELGPDGNVRFDVVDGQPPVAVPLARPDDEFLNVGFGYASYLGQIGVAPAFNDDVELPRYRFRFYSDGSRSQRVVDLPPLPVSQSGDPLDPRPALDERGAPIVGPNRATQLFSTDPGRALITGDPADFEAFDVPQLRGIADTAPYFHDNSHGTLQDVIDAYSRFVLPAIGTMALPAVNPPEGPGLPKESLSVQQKHDLLAFLRRL
jgi:cytochrome c peroxidase